MDVRSRQHRGLNLRSLMRTQWQIFVKLGIVGSGGHKYYPDMVCHHQMRIFNTLFAYLFWLANNRKKSNRHRMCIFNTSFAYLF